MKSRRKDRRGHWTPGKRRHRPARELILEVRRLLRKHSTGPGHRNGMRISRKGIAAALGVSDKTVRRWLAGENHPAPDHKRRPRGWLSRAKRAVSGRLGGTGSASGTRA